MNDLQPRLKTPFWRVALIGGNSVGYGRKLTSIRLVLPAGAFNVHKSVASRRNLGGPGAVRRDHLQPRCARGGSDRTPTVGNGLRPRCEGDGEVSELAECTIPMIPVVEEARYLHSNNSPVSSLQSQSFPR
jgi:hypothetical protein